MAGQVIKRGDRTWLVRVFTGRDTQGKRHYLNQTVNGSKKDADAILRDLLLRRDRGQLHTQPKATVDEYLDTWLQTTAGPSVRARTLSDYTDTLKRYVRPHLGPMLLGKVSPVEIRTMLVSLRKQGLSPRTVRKAHEVIRNAMEQAVSDRLINENPARGRLVRKALPKKEKVERQTVPVDKVQKFIAATKQDRFGAYWLVLLFGGLRPSEALGLKWTDLQGDTLSVQRSLVDKVGQFSFAPPKSKESHRAVPLPAVVVDALKEHRKRQAAEQLKAGAAWVGQGLIFCNPIGGPLRQNQTRKSFKALLEKAELPAMRIYDLRHSAATVLLEMGVDLKIVSERLGHSTIALTADTYAHVTRGMQQQAVAKLDKLTGTA